MTTTQRYLRAKHWKLFLLICGVPMIFQFLLMATMLANMDMSNPPTAIVFPEIFGLFPILTIMFICTLFGWLWAIAIGLQDKLPANLKMNTGKFKTFFFIPAVYMLLIAISLKFTLRMIEHGEEPTIGLLKSSMAIIIPLHLFSMFCMLYCLYFASKTFKTVELQRETTFSDFAGEFFLLWFFPVGVWVVQPKINKMVDGDPMP